MLTVILFLFLLSVLILVHEFGHFIAAKKLGVVAEEFGLGLPPKIRKLFTWEGTEFSLNWLPIGGFVRMKGEDRQATGDERLATSQTGFFYAQKPWKRGIILIAGVTMNMVLGIALFTMVYQVIGIPTETNAVVIQGVAPGSPAEQAGMQPGDIISSVRFTNNDLRFTNQTEFVDQINQHRGETLTVIVERKGQQKELVALPRLEADTPSDEGALGVAIGNIQFVRYPWWQMPFRASITGTQEALGWGGEILGSLGSMMSGLLRGEIPGDISGPVGIAKLMRRVAAQGWIPFAQFAGILSVNLAIVNVLPIPALDGGRLLFLGIEVVRHKPLSPKKEYWAHMVGYGLLIALIALVTMRDLLRPAF